MTTVELLPIAKLPVSDEIKKVKNFLKSKNYVVDVRMHHKDFKYIVYANVDYNLWIEYGFCTLKFLQDNK